MDAGASSDGGGSKISIHWKLLRDQIALVFISKKVI